MKKAIFLYIVISICSANITYGETGINQANIFEDGGKAVIQFTTAVKIDSRKINRVKLFKKLESEIKTPILDQYYCAFLGSGFIISKDGYLVSNHHVSKYLAKKDSQTRLKAKLLLDINKKLIPGILSEAEIRLIFKEFNSYLETARFYNVACTYDGKQYEVQIIKENQEDDLSLLKINSNDKFVPLAVNRNNPIKTGDQVFAFGFPGILESLFSDTKVTFTSGVVSAVREDKWGIQHTASINPGNSGGPLVDKGIKVIGVNGGMISKANGLFFSVPVDKLVNWLIKSGYENILER